MPSLQQLRYLCAVSQTLNFTRAAELCNVTQPTLSLQLKELEARLGVRLIERTRSRVIMTEIGSEVARRAQVIMAEIEDVRDIARSEGRNAMQSYLRLGVVHTVGAYVLSVAMPMFRETYPNTRIHVREDKAGHLLDGLLQGKYDVLVLPEPPQTHEVTTEVILCERLLAVLPRGHRLTDRDFLKSEDVRGETILTTDFGHNLNAAVAEFCQGAGALQANEYDGTTLDTLRQMVATGMGMSLLPVLYVRSEVSREELVIAKEISGAELSRDVSIIWRRTSPRAQSYAELAEVLRSCLRPWSTEVQP